MRLLVVEDSNFLSESLARGLRKSGFAVDVAHAVDAAMRLVAQHDYDAIVLDIMLPGRDGLSMLAELRARGSSVNILLLTAKDTVEDRVHGLQSGADDYLVKPFSFDELVARLQALCRRNRVAPRVTLRLHGLEIDTAARTVRRGNELLDLPPRQYQILEYLVSHSGTVVSRSELEQQIYDAANEPMSNVVDAAIYSLRRKIDLPGEPSLIQTRRGMGYIVPAETASPT